MTKRAIFFTLICLICSISIIGLLTALSYKIKTTKGSFLRSFRPHTINELLTIDLGLNSFYLSGVTGKHIYLGNFTAPLHTLIVTYPSGDTSHVDMTVDGIFDHKVWGVRTEIDSPYFYVHDGAVPCIYRGDIERWKASRFPYDSEYFLNIEPVSRTFLAITSLSRTNETELGRIATLEEPHVILKPELLSKQIDGFFCSDGYLLYEKTHSRLIYLYRYRNEFIVMDTFLTPVYKATTLDTNSIAKIDIVTIASSQSKVFRTPPLVVNDLSASSGNYLFVKSMQVARNEPAYERERASAIDVFDLTDGSYSFTFYIYDFGEEELRELRIHGKKLIALFQTHLQVFELNEHDFEKTLGDP